MEEGEEMGMKGESSREKAADSRKGKDEKGSSTWPPPPNIFPQSPAG